MNGAESLVRTLVQAGVDTCFMNPGTSEIHFVDTLDRVREMRGVPVLFEGVASGAADGYARMAGKPACALFHLGPGLANALANLHNACRARVPLVNIVGDHATYHRRFDPPLAADIEMLARQYSKWLRTSPSSAVVGRDAADAVASAKAAPTGIATLILPSDTAWGEDGKVGVVAEIPKPPHPDQAAIAQAVKMLKNGAPTAILLGPPLTQSETALMSAGRIAAATGAKLLAPFSVTRSRRGAGLPAVERVPYIVDQALPMLGRFSQFILLGAAVPAAFFAWQGKPSVLVPEGATIHLLATPEQDMEGALGDLEGALGAAKAEPVLQPASRPSAPRGPITIEGLASTIAASLPDNAIVIDESITSGRGFMAATKGCPPHDWLVNTGGSIGIGMPLSIGAAVACPDRPVLCLEADGSGMYTVQALWTAAREKLAITILIFANRAYQILKAEIAAICNPGPRALDMLEIGRPDLDWCALAKGMGVPATRAETLEQLARAMQDGIASRAPNLIEVLL